MMKQHPNQHHLGKQKGFYKALKNRSAGHIPNRPPAIGHVEKMLALREKELARQHQVAQDFIDQARQQAGRGFQIMTNKSREFTLILATVENSQDMFTLSGICTQQRMRVLMMSTDDPLFDEDQSDAKKERFTQISKMMWYMRECAIGIRFRDKKDDPYRRDPDPS